MNTNSARDVHLRSISFLRQFIESEASNWLFTFVTIKIQESLRDEGLNFLSGRRAIISEIISRVKHEFK